MNKTLIFVILLLIVAGGIWGIYIWKANPMPYPVFPNGFQATPTPPPAGGPQDNMIRVTTPKPGDTIKSPLRIEGEARGNWYFEASFPAEIIDANGKQLGQMPVQAIGEWMSTEFVPFKTDFAFLTPATETGTLILHKDNPSGLPQHDDERRIPIKFDLTNVPKRAIKLYYYNESKDKDASGNIMCSRQGLEAVNRNVPLTNTPVQDAVKLLLKGELSAGEKANGITTEYPLAGFSLVSASLTGGNLTLTFSDPQNRTTGGSCRVGILWNQIEATAKQFSGVNSVKFLPEELFQP